jgi:phosphate-selective porin OprO/OprP
MTEPANRWRAAALAAASLLPLSAARAEPTIADLLQRIEEQEQKILVLERKLEIKEEADKAAASTAAVVKASDRGFSIQSADAQNQIKLRGVMHVDGRFMVDDETDLTDQWQATRVRPILEGTVGGIYDFRFTPDFGQGRTVIQDAYVTARFQPQLQVTAGKFKSPVGLERLQSASDIRFVSRAFPTSLAPNRDIGLQVAGNLLGERLSYAAAWLNGSNDGSSSETFGDVDLNSDKEWAARLFAHPFAESEHFALRGLGLGIAGTYTDQRGTAAQPLLPSYRTPAQATFFRYRNGSTPTLADGTRTRLAPQFYYYVGSFGLLGEYTEVSQDVARTTTAASRSGTVDSTAWQLAASWFLTGEEASFRGFKPNSVFSLEKDSWGAFELAARYQELSIDDQAFAGGADSFADPSAAARKATGYTLGLNWYLNQNLKWVLNYEHTSFEGGAPGGADRADEQAILTRVALGF